MPPGDPARPLVEAGVDHVNPIERFLATMTVAERARFDGASAANRDGGLEDVRSHVLADAASAVRTIFGADVELSLEQFVDPEAGPEHDRVMLTIRTRASVPEALRLMRELDEQFWLDASVEHGGWLMIRPALV